MAYTRTCIHLRKYQSERNQEYQTNIYDDKIFIRVSTRACDRKKSDAFRSRTFVGLVTTRAISLQTWNRGGEEENKKGSEEGGRDIEIPAMRKLNEFFLSRCTSSLRGEESRSSLSSIRDERHLLSLPLPLPPLEEETKSSKSKTNSFLPFRSPTEESRH